MIKGLYEAHLPVRSLEVSIPFLRIDRTKII